LIVDFDKYFQCPEYGKYYPVNDETIFKAGKNFGMKEDVLRFMNPELRKNSYKTNDGLRIPLSETDQSILNQGLEGHNFLKMSMNSNNATSTEKDNSSSTEKTEENESLGEKAGKFAVRTGVKKT
jgi:hypothetical protein